MLSIRSGQRGVVRKPNRMTAYTKKPLAEAVAFPPAAENDVRESMVLVRLTEADGDVFFDPPQEYDCEAPF